LEALVAKRAAIAAGFVRQEGLDGQTDHAMLCVPPILSEREPRDSIGDGLKSQGPERGQQDVGCQIAKIRGQSVMADFRGDTSAPSRSRSSLDLHDQGFGERIRSVRVRLRLI